MSKRAVKITKQTLDRCVSRDEKVRACHGVYPAQEVAAYFGVSRKTIYEIWKVAGGGETEPPNIRVARTERNRKHDDLYADAVILCARGLSISEVAKQLGTTRYKLERILRTRPSGLEFVQRDNEARKDWKRGRSNPQGSYGYAYDWPNSI